MSEKRFPSAQGLRAAISALDQPVGRAVAHLPVLLAVEASLGAGQDLRADGADSPPVVPNAVLHEHLTEWFGVEGVSGYRYFCPFPLPGGRGSRHWRGTGIVAQNTMSRGINTGWVASAVQVGEDRVTGYPLLNLGAWRAAVAGDVGDQRRGIDLAALGVWLYRRDGLEVESGIPTHDDLVQAAIRSLGLPADHPLLTTGPPVLDEHGTYESTADHFQNTALSDEELRALTLAYASPPTGSVATEPDRPPPSQVVRTVLIPPDPPLELDDRLRRLLRLAIASSSAVMLVGPPGTGKTSLVAEVQAELQTEGGPAKYGLTGPPAGIRPVTPDDDWNAQTLVGGLTLDEHNNLRFRPGFVLDAIRADEWLLLDEANRGDLDKIFGSLLTWLSGQSVVIGPASTEADAPSVVLDWADGPECEVIGYERLVSSSAEPQTSEPASSAGQPAADSPHEDAAATSAPIVFRAGSDWRLLGTYNPVDAQRVFKLGQALGRRFKRVPLPPIEPDQFRAALDARAPALPLVTRKAIERLYEIHLAFPPPLGPAPFLDIAAYVLQGVAEILVSPDAAGSHAEAPDGTGSPNTPTAAAEELVSTSREQVAVTEQLVPGLELTEATGPIAEDLLAEGYLASLGSWLPLLEDDEFDQLQQAAGTTVMSSRNWLWIKNMRRSM